MGGRYGLKYILQCNDLVRWIHLAFVWVMLNLRGKDKGSSPQNRPRRPREGGDV